jgi:hypothetical protein
MAQYAQRSQPKRLPLHAWTGVQHSEKSPSLKRHGVLTHSRGELAATSARAPHTLISCMGSENAPSQLICGCCWPAGLPRCDSATAPSSKGGSEGELGDRPKSAKSASSSPPLRPLQSQTLNHAEPNRTEATTHHHTPHHWSLRAHKARERGIDRNHTRTPPTITQSHATTQCRNIPIRVECGSGCRVRNNLFQSD